MRFTAFILECLMIMMILVPCRDHKGFSRAEGQAQVVHAGQQQSGWADDDCSPLCTCSCCAAVSLMYHVPAVAVITPSPVVKKFSLYIAPAGKAELSAVWQPPRIG